MKNSLPCFAIAGVTIKLPKKYRKPKLNYRQALELQQLLNKTLKPIKRDIGLLVDMPLARS